MSSLYTLLSRNIVFALGLCLLAISLKAAADPNPATTSPPEIAGKADATIKESSQVFLPGTSAGEGDDGKIEVEHLNFGATLTQGNNLRSNRKVAAILLHMEALINSPKYKLAIPKNKNQDLKAKAFWNSDVPLDPFAFPQREKSDAPITQENFDKSLFRIYWYNADVENKNDTRGALWTVAVRSVEYDTDLRHKGDVYVFFDPSASDPSNPNQTASLPPDAKLFVAYLALKKPVKPSQAASTSTPAQSQALVQPKISTVNDPYEVALVSSAGDASSLPTPLPFQFPRTLVAVTPNISVDKIEVTLVARNTITAGPADKLPPTPPLTPPDRAPISFGAVPIETTRKSATQLTIQGLALQGLPFLLPNEGSNDLTLDAIISTENRDPSSKINLTYAWIKPLRRGAGAPAADSVLHDVSNGIFFAPKIDFTTTQRFFAAGSNDRDRRYQFTTAPFRLHFQGRSPLDALRGEYRPIHDADSNDKEKSTLPKADFALDTSFFEFSKDSFSREFSTGADKLLHLQPHGFLGPRLRGDLTWTVPFSLNVTGKSGDKAQLAVRFEGYAIHFVQDRNTIVREYFQRVGGGQIPFDLPRFPSYATHYKISLIIPVNLTIGPINSKEKFFTISYQEGYPESNGFYDIFTKDESQFTLSAGMTL